MVYNLTSSDPGSYTNTQMLVDINAWYEHAVMVILRSRDDWEFDDSNHTDYPILTGDVVANQQDYQLPVSCIKIQRLELAYNGVTPYKAEPIDIGMISKGTSPTQIQQWANTNRPYYDIRYGSVFLYPVPIATTTGNTGMKIWISRNIVEFVPNDIYTQTFTVSGISVNPTAGAVYSNNGVQFTVTATSLSGGVGTVTATGNGIPGLSGTLTKVSGTGDTAVTFSSFANAAVPGFDAPFHQVIAWGAAHNRAVSKNLANADRIEKKLNELLAELATYYGNKDEDMSWSLQPAYEDYGQLNYQTGNIRRIR